LNLAELSASIRTQIRSGIPELFILKQNHYLSVTQIRAREIAFLKCQLEAAGVMVCPSRATHGVSITPVSPVTR